jgi:hypothetical protein
MLGLVVGYVAVRPFVREAARKRHELKTKQRAAKVRSKEVARRPKVTFTDEEREYMAAHVPAQYRR